MISKKIIKKGAIAVGSALTLTVGVAFAVNAMENKEIKSEESKLVEYVYFEFDNLGNPIPISNPSSNKHEEGSNPHNCPDGTGALCSGGYNESDLIYNSTTNTWSPSSSATRYDERRSEED